MKVAPLFIILGLVILWTGFKGNTGSLLASVFTPSRLEVKEDA